MARSELRGRNKDIVRQRRLRAEWHVAPLFVWGFAGGTWMGPGACGSFCGAEGGALRVPVNPRLSPLCLVVGHEPQPQRDALRARHKCLRPSSAPQAIPLHHCRLPLQLSHHRRLKLHELPQSPHTSADHVAGAAAESRRNRPVSNPRASPSSHLLSLLIPHQPPWLCSRRLR